MLLIKATRRIQQTEVGILLKDEILSILVYADDIVIIARSPAGAEAAYKILEEECKEIGMTISVKKSQAVKSRHVGVNAVKDYPLEMVICYKYLGVKVGMASSQYMSEYCAERAEKARVYCLSTIALAKDSPCPALFATRIWQTVALPAIMYGSEAVLIRKKELEEIEKEQAKLAKFILQVPQSTANVVAQTLAGMELIEVMYWRRVLRFYGECHVAGEDTWQYKAFKEMVSMEDPINYCKEIQNMLYRLDLENPRDLESKLIEYGVEKTNRELERCNATCFALVRATKERPTNTSSFFRMDKVAQIYHEFLTLNAGLGNRQKLDEFKERFVICPLCQDAEACFNELHMLYECEVLSWKRESTGIERFIGLHQDLDMPRLHQAFLSGKDVDTRVLAAAEMRDEYFSALHL